MEAKISTEKQKKQEAPCKSTKLQSPYFANTEKL